jgi:uncharacterized membrane protein YhaH (DUF805 family)
MLDLYLKYWRNYAVFSGRAYRKEYWSAILGNFCLSFAISLILGSKLEGLFILVCLLPSIAVVIRRLHDTDHSGWWLLTLFIPIVHLYLLYLVWFAKGTDGANRYGAAPLANANVSANNNAKTTVDVNVDGD